MLYSGQRRSRTLGHLGAPPSGTESGKLPPPRCAVIGTQIVGGLDMSQATHPMFGTSPKPIGGRGLHIQQLGGR
eukprot:6492166-Amphidinium_carterae.2